jgi:hypothetical protein
MEEIQEVIRQMEPEQALASLGGILKDLLTRAGEDARLDFVVNLIGEAGADKVASLVHL